MKRLACVVGTRPEVIKMAPVIRAASTHPKCTVSVIATAQHRELLDEALGWFDICADHDLALMLPDQPIHDLMARALPALVAVLQAEQPDWVLVQGDTTTAFCAALAAFYERIPLAHIEAGLRTGDLSRPFPEEANRRLTDALANHCFAPTERARTNLLAENIPAERITITGNTSIDALKMLLEDQAHLPPVGDDFRGQTILVTAHRRESFGTPLRAICRAICRIVDARPDVTVVYPVHPNPRVQSTVIEMLEAHPRVNLMKPLPYPDLVRLMQCATLILTDSGGLQEEAPFLGKPVLVLRDVTERPEGVEAGVARLVGTSEDDIVTEVLHLLEDRGAYARMARRLSPYGDGKAAGRILDALVSL